MRGKRILPAEENLAKEIWENIRRIEDAYKCALWGRAASVPYTPVFPNAKAVTTAKKTSSVITA